MCSYSQSSVYHLRLTAPGQLTEAISRSLHGDLSELGLYVTSVQHMCIDIQCHSEIELTDEQLAELKHNLEEHVGSMIEDPDQLKVELCRVPDAAASMHIALFFGFDLSYPIGKRSAML